MRRAPALALSATLAFSGAYAQSLGPAPVATGGFASPAAPAVPAAPVSPSDPPAAPKADGAAHAPKAAPKPKPKVAAAPVTHERVVARSDKRPSVHPGTAQALSEAIERYRGIVAAGGWPILPEGVSLQKGATSPHSKTFDAPLVAAVKHFQARHGQSQNGLVSGPTLKALRISAEQRLNALERSAQRYAAHTFGFGQRYIAVNLPSASVEAIENGVVDKHFVAVVGKSERASPEVETRVTNVNLNPTWTVPVSLIKRDIIPRMRRNAATLANMRVRILDRSGNEVNPATIDWSTERAVNYTLRQDPGPGNSLGRVRIDMPNTEAVFMHDTPSRGLFQSDSRSLSSGCVRVADVSDFVTWLLTPQGWTKEQVVEGMTETQRRDVRLTQAVPVSWVYLTGWAAPDGTVQFRDDIYGWDAPGAPPQRVVRPAERPPQAPVQVAPQVQQAPPQQRNFLEGLFGAPPQPGRQPSADMRY